MVPLYLRSSQRVCDHLVGAGTDVGNTHRPQLKRAFCFSAAVHAIKASPAGQTTQLNRKQIFSLERKRFTANQPFQPGSSRSDDNLPARVDLPEPESPKPNANELSFAMAICGLVDLQDQVFRFAGAGGAQVLVMHIDGTYECPESSGLPLAVMEDARYEEVAIGIRAGDRLLLFSDGAIEVHDANGRMLDIQGLVAILKKQRYPAYGIDMDALEEELLKYSNSIRLDDDLTIIEVRFTES